MRASVRSFMRLLGREYRRMLADEGVVLILVGAMLIYATVYALVYAPEVVRDIPVGVVDDAHTAESRLLVRRLDAAPELRVAGNPAGMEAARQQLFDRRIYAIVHIPENFSRDLSVGRQTTVSVYADASYLLLYRQSYQAIASVVVATGAFSSVARVAARGVAAGQAQAVVQPVVYGGHTLYNPSLGYGSYVMPAVLMIIVQQTLLIGLGMLGGTVREAGFYRRCGRWAAGRSAAVAGRVLLARAFAAGSVYVATTAYLLTLHYRLFHYPLNGGGWTLVALVVPYLWAVVMLGVALSTLFRRRETSLAVMLWTSIPVLMVSGVSFPRQAIPPLLYGVGQLLPSSGAVEAFIRVRSMGASIAEIAPEILKLWGLALLYTAVAWWALRRVIRHDARQQLDGSCNPCETNQNR